MRHCKRSSAAASLLHDQLNEALAVLRGGGVIAYPTEFCYGLGCDPQNEIAVQRILAIKRREQAQGLILVAANPNQVVEYAMIDDLARKDEILATWPGPSTWVLPAREYTPAWIKGEHSSVAMRVSSHPLVVQLCTHYNAAIVSTSANRHGLEALISASSVANKMGQEVDFIVDGELSNTSAEQTASNIFDGLSGECLR